MTTRWIIKRNCSASPRQLALVLGSTAAVSFVVGVGFASTGMWMVLPFVGLEMLALALAFFCYGRHAADYERIELAADRIDIEHHVALHASTVSLPRPWARVELERAGAAGAGGLRVFLASGGQRVEVGRLLGEERRADLAHELKLALRTA